MGQKLNSKQLQLGWQAFVSSHHCPEISKEDPLLSFERLKIDDLLHIVGSLVFCEIKNSFEDFGK